MLEGISDEQAGELAAKHAKELAAKREQEFAHNTMDDLLRGTSPKTQKRYLHCIAIKKFGPEFGYVGTAQNIEDSFTSHQEKIYEKIERDLFCYLDKDYYAKVKTKAKPKPLKAVQTSRSSPALAATLSAPSAVVHSSSSDALPARGLVFSDVLKASSSRPASPSSKEADSVAVKERPTSPFSPRNSRR